MGIWAVIVVLAGAYLVFQFIRVSNLGKNNQKMEGILLRVAVSKTNERGPIVAEQIYAALHGLEVNYSFSDYLHGRPKPRLSLEIASVRNLIQFFIWTPRKYRNVIESQIYAQYPDVEIEEVEDYAKNPSAIFEVAPMAAPKAEGQPGIVSYEPKASTLSARQTSAHYVAAGELVFTHPSLFPSNATFSSRIS